MQNWKYLLPVLSVRFFFSEESAEKEHKAEKVIFFYYIFPNHKSTVVKLSINAQIKY